LEAKKRSLIHLVMMENISAIATLSEEMEIPRDEVITLIKELQEEGKLKGVLTQDEKRFFKSEVKVSEAPIIEREIDELTFLKFNARPGTILAIIGLIVIVVGACLNSFLDIQNISDYSAILIFVGLCIMLIGLFWIAQRKTPE